MGTANRSISDELLLAEAQLHVGEWKPLVPALDRLVRHRSEGVQAPARLLRAELHGYRAEIALADEDFRVAIALATVSLPPEFTCYARVRRFACTAELSTSAETLAMADELRASVLATASEFVLAAYHVTAAKFEATRGHLSAAGAHEALAGERLKDRPNLWLSAGLCLSRSCTAFLRGDLSSAIAEAERACDYAQASSDLWSQAAAAANLGFLHLYTGNLTAASQQLLAARKSGRDLPILQIATLDSWVRLALLRNDTPAAETGVRDIDMVFERFPALAGSWYQVGTLQTKVRVRRHLKDWAAVGAVAREGIRLAQQRADPDAAAFFDAAAAEALLESGRIEDATDHFAAACSGPSASADVKIETSRVRAGLLAAAGHLSEARLALEVADSLARACGDAIAGSDVDLARAGLEARSGIQAPDDQAARLLWSILSVADHPGALAIELLRRLAQAGCISAGRVSRVSRTDRYVLHEVADAGGPAAEDATPLELDVSDSIRLSIVPRPDFRARYATNLALHFLAFCRERSRPGAAADNPWQAVAEVSADAGVASRDMQRVTTTALRVAPLDVSILITGETGVGKEVLARRIHQASKRSAGPFVPFNCSAVPRDMLESQLFGHRRGAFTGAVDAFAGVIRSAQPGTLFLDEVADLPLELQPKILRFLEAGEVHPLGDPRPTRANVRVIAATNADLDDRVARHLFREDLYFRLNTIHLKIPPLRARRDEIPALAQAFLGAHAEEFGRGILRLEPATIEQLVLFDWPGNVRQLSNEMRRVAALADRDCAITPAMLSFRVRAVSSAAEIPPARVCTVAVEQGLADAVATLERAMIAHALEANGGRLDAAARALGISRKGLFLKRRRLGIPGGHDSAS